jgi:hypothetical protein
VRESAVSAKRGLGLVWRETGAVRNARPSRGQAASTRKRAKWGEDGTAFRLRTDDCTGSRHTVGTHENEQRSTDGRVD